MQPQSITRSFLALWAAALAWLGAPAAPYAAPLADRGETSAIQAGIWREAPEYLELFAARVHREMYRAYVTAESLDRILRSLEADPDVLRPPGSWTARPVIAFDAFGQSGTYDRWNLLRLYGATRVRVARGPRHGEGGNFESWTLASPYPDPAMDHLQPGTLRLVLRVPPL